MHVNSSECHLKFEMKQIMKNICPRHAKETQILHYNQML